MKMLLAIVHNEDAPLLINEMKRSILLPNLPQQAAF